MKNRGGPVAGPCVLWVARWFGALAALKLSVAATMNVYVPSSGDAGLLEGVNRIVG